MEAGIDSIARGNGGIMRIQCPTCVSVFEVPDARVAGGAQMRCGRCGLVFGLEATRFAREPVPPPEVVYVKREALPPPPATVPVEPVPDLPVPDFPGPEPEAREPPPRPRGAEALGPPPPYIPIGAREKPAPPSPAPGGRTAGEGTGARPGPGAPGAGQSVRLAGMLGPPPPYRPAEGAVQGFERGPAPDLEPWREDGLTRGPAPPPPGEADLGWDFAREPPPEPPPDRAAPASPGVPVPWPYENEPPPPPMFGPKPGRAPWTAEARSRLIRRVVVGTVVVAVLVSVGAASIVWRATAIRYVPALAGVYQALGLGSQAPPAR